MQTVELLSLIEEIQRRKAEGQTIEVKAAHEGCPKRLYDTLSSFSNQDAGGIIVFGLDEKQGFAAVGVYDLQDLQKNVTEQCNQMEPPVRAVFTAAELEGKLLCAGGNSRCGPGRPALLLYGKRPDQGLLCPGGRRGLADDGL